MTRIISGVHASRGVTVGTPERFGEGLNPGRSRGCDGKNSCATPPENSEEILLEVFKSLTYPRHNCNIPLAEWMREITRRPGKMDPRHIRFFGQGGERSATRNRHDGEPTYARLPPRKRGKGMPQC